MSFSAGHMTDLNSNRYRHPSENAEAVKTFTAAGNSYVRNVDDWTNSDTMEVHFNNRRPPSGCDDDGDNATNNNDAGDGANWKSPQCGAPISNAGRARQAIYYPAYLDGPELDDDVLSYAPATRQAMHRFVDYEGHVGSGADDGRPNQTSRSEGLVSQSSQTSIYQTERPRVEVVTSPSPRQVTFVSGSRSYERETSSSVTSPSSITSPAAERGECIIVESSKRLEITIQPKRIRIGESESSRSNMPAVSVMTDEEKRLTSGVQPPRVRPPRRSRPNDGVAVVEAVVCDTREIIKAKLVEPQADNMRLSPSGDAQFRSPGQTHESNGEKDGREERGSPLEILNDNEKSRNKSHALKRQEENYEMEQDEYNFEQLGRSEDVEMDQSPLPMSDDAAAAAAVAAAVAAAGNVMESSLTRQGSIRPRPKESRRKVASSSSSTHRERKPGSADRQRPPPPPPPPSHPPQHVGENKTVEISGNMRLSSDADLQHPQLIDAEITGGKAGMNSIDLGSRESERANAAAKMSMDRLKKKTRVGPSTSASVSGTKPSSPQVMMMMETESAGNLEPGTQDLPREQINIVLHKDEKGYGMTMTGTKPVVVQAVRKNGIAEISGILPGDEIFKINGSYMYDKDHGEVIKYIRAAGSFVELNLRRKLRPSSGQSSSSSVNRGLSTVPRSTSQPKQTQSMKELHQKLSGYDGSSAAKSFNNIQGSQSMSKIREITKPAGANVSSGNRKAAGRSGTVNPFTAGQSDSGKGMLSTTVESKVKPKPVSVIGVDCDDLSDEEEFPIPPFFSDILMLKQSIAHLSVFLNFLISNSEPAPMLFSMITDYYHAAVRESGFAIRWAFEIYTTFLVQGAPLKLSVDDGMVSSIENVLRNSKDIELRTVFRPVENFVREKVLVNQLTQFCTKISLGLGTMYGAHELKENMDHNLELKIVENTLFVHFERFLADESKDSSQAMAFCLATFFRQIDFVGRKVSLLEFCPSFIYKDKDKKILRYRLKKNYESKGHTFNPHQCTNVMKCQTCEKLIWGIGFQAYQCSNCDLVVHRQCADPDVVWQLCSGTLRRAGGRKVRVSHPIRDASKSVFHVPSEDIATRTGERSLDEIKNFPSRTDKPELSDAEQRSESDSEAQRMMINRPSSWPNIIPEIGSQPSTRASNQVATRLSDPDFDVEPELPPLSQVLSKEALKKLKGKDRKKQEYINELFYTEKTHLRSLKVLHQFFLKPMREDGGFSKDFLNHVFSNLDEVIEVHGNLNEEFKALRQKSEIVSEIGEVLVSRLSGEKGSKFKQMASKFCQDQLYAFALLKAKQKKDPRLGQILQDAAMNYHSGRQELKDLLPREMQRLTKYPLLIDNILNCTPTSEVEEHNKLTLALRLSKDLLEHVNQAVRDCENYRRTQDMQKRLDRRPIEGSTHPTLIEYKNLNLTEHKMIYDGELVWRRSPRPIDIHMALFEHFVIILQKQDDRLVLRCQNTAIENVKYPFSPIMKLQNLLTTDVATDKRAFFLVYKSSTDPNVLELVANSKEEKNRWCFYIKEAVEKYHKQYSNEPAVHHKVHPPVAVLSSGMPLTSLDITDNVTNNELQMLDLNESIDEQPIADELNIRPLSSDEVDLEEVDGGQSFGGERVLQDIEQKIALIHEALADKAHLLSPHSSHFDETSAHEESRNNEQTTNATDLISRALEEVKQLSQIAESARSENENDDSIIVSPAELLQVHERIHRLLAKLTVEIAGKDISHDRLEEEEEDSDREFCLMRDSLPHVATVGSGRSVVQSSADARKTHVVCRPTSYMAALGDETNGDFDPTTNSDDENVLLMPSTANSFDQYQPRYDDDLAADDDDNDEQLTMAIGSADETAFSFV